MILLVFAFVQYTLNSNFFFELTFVDVIKHYLHLATSVRYDHRTKVNCLFLGVHLFLLSFGNLPYI